MNYELRNPMCVLLLNGSLKSSSYHLCNFIKKVLMWMCVCGVSWFVVHGRLCFCLEKENEVHRYFVGYVFLYVWHLLNYGLIFIILTEKKRRKICWWIISFLFSNINISPLVRLQRGCIWGILAKNAYVMCLCKKECRLISHYQILF